jgi:hypothetical protein
MDSKLIAYQLADCKVGDYFIPNGHSFVARLKKKQKDGYGIVVLNCNFNFKSETLIPLTSWVEKVVVL